MFLDIRFNYLLIYTLRSYKCLVLYQAQAKGWTKPVETSERFAAIGIDSTELFVSKEEGQGDVCTVGKGR